MDDDPFIGPEDAPVVIVEFSDFFCGFCGQHYEQTLTPILEDYDGYVRYVYRDFPGVGGDFAVLAAMGAECAHDQDAFWIYHNTLFERQGSLPTTSMDAMNAALIDQAEELGLDVEPFTTCLESQQHLNEVLADLSDAQSAGARGTPAFIINGRLYSGAQPYEQFASIIEGELADQGIDYQPAG
jgi:protein-disulfide isomerase